MRQCKPTALLCYGKVNMDGKHPDSMTFPTAYLARLILTMQDDPLPCCWQPIIDLAQLPTMI